MRVSEAEAFNGLGRDLEREGRIVGRGINSAAAILAPLGLSASGRRRERVTWQSKASIEVEACSP